MAATLPATPPELRRFAGAIVAGVRSDAPDLTQRQMAVLLTVDLEPGPHTVRGLADRLNVAKPVITRALDRLGELDFAVRRIDPADRRSCLVTCTRKGAAHVLRIAAALAEG